MAVIYLDNGATSLPKPRAVVESVTRSMTRYASPSRGSSRASTEAENMLYALRQEAGTLFDCDPERVILTTSATHGLNIAIKSLAKKGDRVVVSGMEHNAVMRPLYAMGAQLEIARGQLFDDHRLLEEFDKKLTRDTKLCIINHVSNVFGWIQPIASVAAMCRQRNIPLIVDASQSAGTIPISLNTLGASFIAMPGHKGLLGPMGTGLLLCGAEPEPLLEGGTGSLSKELQMPEFLPDRLEPGTHNIPGAAGLLAGIRWVKARGMDSILRHEQAMAAIAAEALGELPQVRLFRGENQTGLLSFVPEEQDCVLLGEALGAQWNIALRAGLHCAPTAHETAGTLETGTIRMSPGPFTTPQHIHNFAACLKSALKIVKKP